MHPFLSAVLGYRLPYRLEEKVQGRHSLILGKTGSGKSELLKTLIYRLQEKSQHKRNLSLVVLDPHGQLTETCLCFQMNQKNSDRVVYLNPVLDLKQIPCINPFWVVVPNLHQAQIMAQERTYAFLQLIGNSTLSLQMQTILEPVLTALFLAEQQELSTLQRRMKAEETDSYFEILIDRLPPILKNFFKEGFYDKRYALSKTSIYTKIQSIQNHEILFHMLNGRPTLDLEKEITA